jgi:hypothetical protein
MTVNDAVNNLYATYAKYGTTKQFLREMIESGIKQGFSVRVAYNGVRMCLGKETGEREYFTLDELQEITGESREELVARAEQMKNELRAAGKNPDEYIKEIPSAGHNILYFPNGLTS